MSDNHPSRIIVAEDEPASLKLLSLQLRKEGYDVVACKDGNEALEAIRQDGSCIVVTDWMMPGMDGIELCRAVRSLTEMGVLKFVYFILLTAHSEKEQIVSGFEAGADDYLTKPYHPRELLARLRAGERIYSLQMELLDRQIELHKANAELASLANKLDTLASTDVLTGLANRRSFFDRGEEAWALSDRQGQYLSCLMFDIDKFKLVNDTYGHASGDDVLRHVSGIARKCLRKYDVIGRVGGEEFCVFCPDTPLAGAATLAERLRRDIVENVCTSGETAIPVSVSIGVATRTPAHQDPEALISDADAMLYQAKENGRNQVWLCDPGRGAHRYEPSAADQVQQSRDSAIIPACES